MAQLKDLIVAGSARLLGKTYFEDTVTINDTLEVDAIKADNVIMPNLNSDGTALTIGGNVSLTTSGKYITVGDGTASSSTSTGVLRVNGGLNTSKSSYFDDKVTLDTLTIKNTSAVGHINFSRGNYNYITAPTSGIIAFIVNGQSVGDTTSELTIKDGEVCPGMTNATSLGTSSYRWSSIYGINLNITGNTTLGDTTFSNNVIINNTLTVKGNTTLGDATSDITTVQGTISLTGDGTLATGSTATSLSSMTGNIKVFNGGIVTNKDVAADNFYVKDKVRIKYDSTNDYLYFVFN